MGDTAVLGVCFVRLLSPGGSPGLMLVELSVVEQRYHTVIDVVFGGIPVVEVAAPGDISPTQQLQTSSEEPAINLGRPCRGRHIKDSCRFFE
jgi:hypothetical protein